MTSSKKETAKASPASSSKKSAAASEKTETAKPAAKSGAAETSKTAPKTSDSSTRLKTDKPAVSEKGRTIKAARAEGRSAAKDATPEQKAKRSEKTARKGEGKGLDDLFEHMLKDMYYAEKKIHAALPQMVKAADHPDLKKALEAHRAETAEHVKGLEAIFEMRGQRPQGEKCDAIDGILKECEGLAEDFADTAAADAMIIMACQAVEHYEITRYGTMSAFADSLGLSKAKAQIEAILEQEKAADVLMTKIAVGAVNDAAAEYDADEPAAKDAPKAKAA